MTKEPARFTGTPAQLKQVVGLTGIAGTWQRMPARYWRYLCDDGAILNWWPTGTINFQGPERAKAAFEQAIIHVINRGSDPSGKKLLAHSTTAPPGGGR